MPLVRACGELGIGARTAQRWRARAWSRDPADAPFVQLEQAIWRGRVAAAETGQGLMDDPAGLSTLEEMLAPFAVEDGPGL